MLSPATQAAPPPSSAALWRGRILCAGAALMWSTSGLFIKTLTAAVPHGAGWSGWQVGGMRSLIAAAVLFALASLAPTKLGLQGGGNARMSPRGEGARSMFWPSKPQWVIALFLAPTVLLYALAQAYTSTANAIFLQYTAPLYVLLLAPRALGEPTRARDLLAMGAMLAGMALILPSGILQGHYFGSAMAVLSGVCFAGVILSLRQWRDGSGVAGAAWGNVLAAAVALPVAAFTGAGLAAPTPSSAAQILFLGVFQIGVAYYLFQRSLRMLPAAEAAILALLEPVACPLWAYLALGEKPHPWAAWGGAVIVAALALHSLAASRGSPDAAHGASRRSPLL